MKNLDKIVFLIAMAGMITALMSSCSKRFVPSSASMAKEKGSRDSIKFMISHDTISGSIEPPAIKNKPFSESSSLSGEKQSVRDRQIEELLKTARLYLGVPHCMGGTTFKCIDCSGFVMKVFEELGIMLPHNAQAQSQSGRIIKHRNELIEGDVVFFKESYKTKNYITHSGIYIGNNKFIHTSSGKGVTITSLDDSWWKDKFVHGSRLIE